MKKTNCGLCHECGFPLKKVVDGEEWCQTCQTYRRYRSHGFSAKVAERGHYVCPDWALLLPERQEWLKRIGAIA